MDETPRLGCALFDLPPRLVERVKRLASRIADGDLAEDGREDRPHLTVCFGLHTSDAEAVRRVVEGFGAVEITLGRVSVFDASETAEGADVVKIEVEGDRLRELNQLLRESLEVTDTHPGYNPHITLAYVLPGRGREYVGRSSLTGQRITLTDLTFSDPARERTTISLDGGRGDEPQRYAMDENEQRQPAQPQPAPNQAPQQPQGDPAKTTDASPNAAKLEAMLWLLSDAADRALEEAGGDEGRAEQAYAAERDRIVEAMSALTPEAIEQMRSASTSAPRKQGDLLQAMRPGQPLRYEAPRVPRGSRVNEQKGGQWVDARHLAYFYARLWRAMTAAGRPPTEAEVAAANEEINGHGWAVEDAEGGWTPKQLAGAEQYARDPLRYAAVRAPAGHGPSNPLVIGGKPYRSGMFIPGEVLEKATPAEKAQLAAAQGGAAARPSAAPSPGEDARRAQMAGQSAEATAFTDEERARALARLRAVYRKHGADTPLRLGEIVGEVIEALLLAGQGDPARGTLKKPLAQVGLMIRLWEEGALDEEPPTPEKKRFRRLAAAARAGRDYASARMYSRQADRCARR